MKGVVVPLICLTALHAFADVSSDQYQAIPKRNAFGLKEKAPPPVQEDREPPPANARVVLNGITTILGTRQALLQIVPPQPRPGEQPESLILAEGQSDGTIKVIKINEDEGWVRIQNSGVDTTIRFEDPPPAAIANAQGGASAPGSSLTGANNSAPASRLPPTNNLAGAPGLSPPVVESRRFPTRSPRTQAEVPPLASYSTSLSTTSTQGVPATVSSPATPTSSATTSGQLTSEEQGALMQIEQQLRRDQATPPSQQQQQVEIPPPAGANQPYIYSQPRLSPAPLPLPPSQPGRTVVR